MTHCDLCYDEIKEDTEDWNRCKLYIPTGKNTVTAIMDLLVCGECLEINLNDWVRVFKIGPAVQNYSSYLVPVTWLIDRVQEKNQELNALITNLGDYDLSADIRNFGKKEQ